ncbi:MAG: hypothetical protein Q9222_003642 [Ikaeria aurantiellina]
MADNSEHRHHETLEPPRKSVELEDPGAHELSSENEDETHEKAFSDAQEDSNVRSRHNSPIPTTRVDDRDSHGEIPGTEAYNQRLQDAVPDELEIVGDTSNPSRRNTKTLPNRTATPGGTPIPMTVVEKVDATSPGTTAHSMRKADAVPDKIVQSPNAKASFGDDDASDAWISGGSISPEVPVPKTVVNQGG